MLDILGRKSRTWNSCRNMLKFSRLSCSNAQRSQRVLEPYLYCSFITSKEAMPSRAQNESFSQRWPAKDFRFILHHSAMHVKGIRSISTHPFFTRHGLEWTTPVLRLGRREAKRSAGSPTRALSMHLALKTHRV